MVDKTFNGNGGKSYEWHELDATWRSRGNRHCLYAVRLWYSGWIQPDRCHSGLWNSVPVRYKRAGADVVGCQAGS